MKELDIKRRTIFAIGPHLLGLLFIGVGLFTILSPLFITDSNSVERAVITGGIAACLGILVLLSYGGTEFNFEEKKYRAYYSIAGLKTGKWLDLPSLKQIRVIPHTFKGSQTFDGVHPTTSGTITQFVIALYADQPKPILVLENSNKELALKYAQVLGQGLKVAVEANV